MSSFLTKQICHWDPNNECKCFHCKKSDSKEDKPSTMNKLIKGSQAHGSDPLWLFSCLNPFFPFSRFHLVFLIQMFHRFYRQRDWMETGWEPLLFFLPNSEIFPAIWINNCFGCVPSSDLIWTVQGLLETLHWEESPYSPHVYFGGCLSSCCNSILFI